jgi:signal transduction histidine kinase/HAMP domain-containing protein
MSRGRVFLVVFGPALILIAGRFAAYRAGADTSGSSRPRLEARAAELGQRLDRLVAHAEEAAARAREGAPELAREDLPETLASRFEGAGRLRNGRFDTWTGTPAEAASFGEPGSAQILSRGIRTSLLVSTPQDASGSRGVASFVLEIRAGPMRADDILGSATQGISARWDFSRERASAPAAFDPGPPSQLSWPWRAAGARPLAALVLEEPGPAAAAARIRARAAAWAALLFVALAALATIRRPARVDARRLLTVVSVVIACRAALVSGRTIEELLPRALGSPSLYGRGDWWGLCASPAALFATALCVYFILAAVSKFAAGAISGKRGAALALMCGAGGGGLVLIVALAGSSAADARVRVPRLDPSSPGTLALTLAAACLLAGVAEVVAGLVAAARPRTGDAAPGRLAVAAALVPLSLLFLAQSYRVSQRMVDDRLRSEYAPLVAGQSARRRIALTAAIGESAASSRVASALARPEGEDDPFLAYDLWTGSDLFHEGFASSLDLYDADGARRGHFGFAFPQVGGERETAARATNPAAPPFVELETVPAGASQLRVVHAEAAVAAPGGGVAGRVVGHVLEEPGNLPFLPDNAPYLEALGGGGASGSAPAAEAPDYVVYDEDGSVVLSTVHQPPAASPALRAAAAAGRRLDITSGELRYHALPLMNGMQLHLLLMPAPTALGLLADAVRLLLAGLAIVAAAALAGTVSGRGGLPALLDVVRGSFYRRLLATVLAASILPLIGLSFFLRAYIDRRGEASLTDSAAAVVGAARRVVEDYLSVGEDDPAAPRLRITDETLWWLRRVVGQEIHVYEGGVLAATSKPELFDSALLPVRLPGEVDRDVVRGGQPFVVRHEHLGALPVPVAYAPVDEPSGPRDAVIAIPLAIEQRDYTRSVDRLVEMLLLLTTALVLLLAASAAWIARSVAEPVRRLALASRRIAGGDYGARLAPSSRDEMGSLVTDFNGMAAALAGQRADIERRREYIEALLRHATTGVVSTDAAGRIVTINPAACALLGTSGSAPRAGEALQTALGRVDALRPLAAALSDPRTIGASPIEVDLAMGEATSRYRVVAVPLPVPEGGAEGTLILLDDVTSLMKSNQLAAWAEMARAIAHEIKNPLTPIQLSAEHVRKLLRDRGVPPTPEIEACLDTIVRNVRELRDISGAFSTYAKIPELELARIDPAAFLRGVAAPYRAAPPPGVVIEERHDDAPEILADPKILARAIVNLIENAVQAMPGGGTLRLASGPGEPGEVVLTVGDTGSGLTAAVRARLFEPYFSTKSSGTGLGLAIVRRVVLGHGGAIDVAATAGGGTTFRIRLKLAP